MVCSKRRASTCTCMPTQTRTRLRTVCLWLCRNAHLFLTLGGTPAAAFHTDIFLNPTSHLKPHSTLKSSAQDNINTKTKCAARMHICWLAHAKVSQQANVFKSLLMRLSRLQQKTKKNLLPSFPNVEVCDTTTAMSLTEKPTEKSSFHIQSLDYLANGTQAHITSEWTHSCALKTQRQKTFCLRSDNTTKLEPFNLI